MDKHHYNHDWLGIVQIWAKRLLSWQIVYSLAQRLNNKEIPPDKWLHLELILIIHQVSWYALINEYIPGKKSSEKVSRSLNWVYHQLRAVVFSLICLNKQLSKQSRRWWFEMPSHSLWHQCNHYLLRRLVFWSISTKEKTILRTKQYAVANDFKVIFFQYQTETYVCWFLWIQYFH